MMTLARVAGVGIALLRAKSVRTWRRWATSASDDASAVNVEGLDCERVIIEFPPNKFNINEVLILEASAASQEILVDRALELESNGAEGDPYGVVSWPASRTVANRLLQLDLTNCRVLELGAGTGLVSLTAALCGASHVVASDFNPYALEMIKQAAKLQSVPISSSSLTTMLFDITDHTKPLPEADLMVIADLLYNPITGEAVARRIFEAVKRGTKVIIADSPKRPGRPKMLEVLSMLMGRQVTFQTVPGQGIVGGVPRHELISETKTKTKTVAEGEGETKRGANDMRGSLPEPLDMALLEL